MDIVIICFSHLLLITSTWMVCVGSYVVCFYNECLIPLKYLEMDFFLARAILIKKK